MCARLPISAQIIFVLIFWVSLYIIYPRAGTERLAYVDSFNEGRDSIKSLFDLALTGSKFSLEFESAVEQSQDFSTPNASAYLDPDSLGYERALNLITFSYYYCWCAVTACNVKQLLALVRRDVTTPNLDLE